jgi:hypothetical protein
MYDGGEEFMLVDKGNVHILLGENMLIFLNLYYVPIMELNYEPLSPSICHL